MLSFIVILFTLKLADKFIQLITLIILYLTINNRTDKFVKLVYQRSFSFSKNKVTSLNWL